MRRFSGLAAALIITAALLTGCTARVGVDEMMATRERIRSSNIYIENTLYTSGAFGHFYEVGKSLGSGAVFERDENWCYALTNWHVIESESYARAAVTVTDIYGNLSDATVELSDKSRDIAILRFRRGADDIPCIDYSSRARKPLEYGEIVFAVGNPGQIKNNVTFGQYLGMSYIKNVEYRVLHHNALIYEGNSGGALCDLNGHLVGLNTWGSEETDENNFSIPLSVVRDFISEWREGRTQAAA